MQEHKHSLTMDEQTVYLGKSTAIISYFTFVGLLIAISMNSEPKNPFARFHINQSAGLILSYLLIMIPVSYLNSFAAFIGFLIAFISLWLFGIVSAFQGKATPIPLVGAFFQQVFGKI